MLLLTIVVVVLLLINYGTSCVFLRILANCWGCPGNPDNIPRSPGSPAHRPIKIEVSYRLRTLY